MNQVNVPPALLTLLACDLPSLCAGQTEAFTLAIHSLLGRKKNVEHEPLTNQEILFVLNVFGKASVQINLLKSQS